MPVSGDDGVREDLPGRVDVGVLEDAQPTIHHG
jgi:hypothetical protein